MSDCFLSPVEEVMVVQEEVTEVVEDDIEDLQKQLDEEEETRATEVSQQSPLTPQKQDTKVPNTCSPVSRASWCMCSMK